MKKFFTLFAALMMLSASAGTLSLYDGTDWSAVVPFNGMYLDTQGNKTQVLYPAADLTDMIGQEITAITFYTNDGCPIDNCTVNISLGETDANVMTGYITEGMTQVGTFSFTKFEGQGEITITFDTPYTYQGGNLVFENVVAQASPKFDYIYCIGMETNYDNCYVTTFGAGPRQFLPKTTFTYGGEEPQFTRGDVDMDGTVGIADVTALIDYILTGNAEGIDLNAADVDQDTQIGIADVTALIDFILTGAW